MNLHEYQSKNLFAEYGIPVQAGEVARSAEEAVKNAKNLGGKAWLVKAQVHAGGRGKAGGVKFTTDLKELESTTKALIGSQSRASIYACKRFLCSATPQGLLCLIITQAFSENSFKQLSAASISKKLLYPIFFP